MDKIWYVYLIAVNLVGFAAMGIDKYKAVRHRWRIPEKGLFLIALVGGSAGSWAGMYLFRHKTRHWSFVIGMPLILAAQAVVCWLLFF